MFKGSCKPDKNRNAFHIVFMAVGCLGSIFNLGIFMMISYFIRRHKNFRTPCNLILWGIFLSDTLANVVAFPLRGIGSYCNVHTFASCQVAIAITRFAGNISSFLLLVLTIERFTKITYFQFYPRMFSLTKTKLIMLGVYISSFVLSCIVELNWYTITHFPPTMRFKKCFYTMIFNDSYGIFIELCLQVAPLLATLIIHACLFCYVKRNLMDFSAATNNATNGLISRPSKRLRRRKVRVEIKLAISAFLLCGIYVIFVFPIVVVDLIQMFEGAFEYPTRTIIPDMALQFAIGMVILYPSVEGLVLLFTNPSVFKYFSALVYQEQPRESTASYSHPTAQ